MLKSQRSDIERDKLIEKSKKKKWIDKVFRQNNGSNGKCI